MAAPPTMPHLGGIPQPCLQGKGVLPSPVGGGGDPTASHSPTGEQKKVPQHSIQPHRGNRSRSHSPPREQREVPQPPPKPRGKRGGSHSPPQPHGGGIVVPLPPTAPRRSRGGSHSPGEGHPLTPRKEGEVPPPPEAPPAPPHPQLQHGGVDGGRPVPLEAGHHGGEQPVAERRLGRGMVAGALARDGERPSAAGTAGEQRPVTTGAVPAPRRYLGRLQSRAPTAAAGSRARLRPHLPGQVTDRSRRTGRPGPGEARPAPGGARRPQAGTRGQQAPGDGERCQPQHGRSRGTRKRPGST